MTHFFPKSSSKAVRYYARLTELLYRLPSELSQVSPFDKKKFGTSSKGVETQSQTCGKRAHLSEKKVLHVRKKPTKMENDSNWVRCRVAKQR